MFMLAQILMTSMVLAIIILVIVYVLSKTSSYLNESEKSPFECGFIPWENSWQSFSIQFFLVALIFLIFDVELILLFPVLVNLKAWMSFVSIMVFMVFMIILIMGLMIEWLFSQLDWFI